VGQALVLAQADLVSFLLFGFLYLEAALGGFYFSFPPIHQDQFIGW